MERKYYNNIGVIDCPGIVVKVDKSKFSKIQYHRWHRVDSCWVLEMVERTPERIRILVVVSDSKVHTLIDILRSYIHPESIIYSDC